MAKRFLIFQHVPWEGPGTHLVRSAERRGVQLEVIELWREPIPDLAVYAGLIVLGGTPNVGEEGKYPFLHAEKATIRRCIQEDRPYLGFCLGHQLLADALGATVRDNFHRSVGFVEGRITRHGRKHPLFANFPKTLPLFKWHGQAILPPVPKHIEVLVTSSDCEVEAISVAGRPHIIGFQFDNHAGTRTNITNWIEKDRGWLSSSPVDPSSLLAEAVRLETHMGEQFDILFGKFLDLV